jgi:hypothetical protein
MQDQSVYRNFLQQLGRLLMARYQGFHEVCQYSEIVTTDAKGYLTIKLSLVQQFFAEGFEQLVREVIDGRPLPPQPKLLEWLKSDGVLTRPSPIETHYRKLVSKRKARKQMREFERVVTGCLPICIENVRLTMQNQEAVTQKEDSQLVPIEDAAKSLGVSRRTLLGWIRCRKIEAQYREYPQGIRRLVGIPQTALTKASLQIFLALTFLL